MNVFNYYKMKSNITSLNGNSINWNSNFFYGFGMIVSINTTYYIADNTAESVHMFNEEWKYISSKGLIIDPNYMIAINSNLYITGYNSIVQTDKNVNVLLRYDYLGVYCGIYYNATNNLIYVVAHALNSIDLFDLNLNLVDSISTSSYSPYSISVFIIKCMLVLGIMEQS